MKQLLKTNELVKEILTDIPDTRDSDNYLYLKVLERAAAMQGASYDINKMSIPYFLCNVKKLNLPNFETVGRARRKLQAACPDLRGTAKVEAARAEKEAIFREYAKIQEG